MPASFVFEFTSLIIFGAHATVVVAVAAAIARAVGDLRWRNDLRTLLTLVTVAAATEAAGYVHLALGGTLGQFRWPFEAVPIAGAVGTYYLVNMLSCDVVGPLLAKQRVDPSCRERILIDSSPYFIGAGIAVGVAEVIGHQAWELLPVVAVPLAFALATYNDYVRRLDDEHRSRPVLDSLDERDADHALRRSEERLALAADGANDGWWEWDLRTKEFYVSARWSEIVGLPAEAGVGRPEHWLDRVHPSEMAAVKDSLSAHLSGKTPHFQHEHRMRHQDGTYRSFVCRGIAARGDGRMAVRIAGSLTDITEHARARQQLRSAGFRDPLTGLRNRADFVDVLGRRLETFRRKHHGPGRFAILYLDLDRFKVVNDSLGHLVGDQMLIAVSRRLESCLREGDTLARLGGDEFAILLQTVGDEQQANAFAFHIQEVLSTPIMVAGREVFTTASIGIAFGASDHNSPDEILRDADTAMYHAKSRGKARHEMFDADLHARTKDRLDLENDLRHAVHNNDFEVVYQPIVLLGSGLCVGFESLVRWTRNGKPVSPVTFVPMAEELGLIESLGTSILQQACETFAAWKHRYPTAGLDYVTVNVSSRQLMQQNFLRIVEQAVEKSGLTPRDLRLEITETALMDSPAVAAQVLRQLRAFGAKIYLDDFGTGYSSLSHLHKLPVDALKIDRSFVTSLGIAERPAIVESIMALARTMNTSVVAEGIETEGQARELERLGCTHAQGYLFSRPLSAKAAEDVIAAQKPLGPKGAEPVQNGDSDLYYSSKPFKWPDTISRR
jgi:diguanylate cyclase (GGDEF)-like protein/PAS domain S-box-containing protein